MSPSSTALQSGAGINLGARVNWLSLSPANDFPPPLSQAYMARPRPKDMKLLFMRRQGETNRFGVHRQALRNLLGPAKSTTYVVISKHFLRVYREQSNFPKWCYFRLQKNWNPTAGQNWCFCKNCCCHKWRSDCTAKSRNQTETITKGPN